MPPTWYVPASRRWNRAFVPRRSSSSCSSARSVGMSQRWSTTRSAIPLRHGSSPRSSSSSLCWKVTAEDPAPVPGEVELVCEARIAALRWRAQVAPLQAGRLGPCRSNLFAANCSWIHFLSGLGRISSCLIQWDGRLYSTWPRQHVLLQACCRRVAFVLQSFRASSRAAVVGRLICAGGRSSVQVQRRRP